VATGESIYESWTHKRSCMAVSSSREINHRRMEKQRIVLFPDTRAGNYVLIFI
jgi:hypothetical protein